MAMRQHQLRKSAYGLHSAAFEINRQLAEGNLQSDDVVAQLIVALYETADKLQDLIRTITNLSSPDMHNPCKLMDAVKHSQALHATSLARKGVIVEIDVEGDPEVFVPFDVAVLALATLIGNANDAVTPGGKIWLKSETSTHSTICKVSDNGHGVPKKIQKDLFEQKVTTTKPKGEGVGLYYTKTALEDYFAEIELTQTSGQGSVFTIKFPIAKGGESCEK